MPCLTRQSLLLRKDLFMNVIQKIIGWTPQLLNGAKITILLTLCSVCAGLILGIFLALGSMSKSKILRSISKAYVFFFRGTPLLMQLYFVYYGLPEISRSLTINSKFLAAFIAFGLNSGAYCSEIFRSASQGGRAKKFHFFSLFPLETGCMPSRLHDVNTL